jgi:glycosyltransferase involved in cell wall biosynthesis
VRGYLPYLSFDLPLAFRLLLHRRADLYFVEPPPTTGAVVRVITWLLRRPYFYDAADVWADAAALATSSRLVLALLRRVELFALRGATHIFTISGGVATRMRELGVVTPAAVVGFGVDPQIFRYQQSDVTEAGPYFIYAGTYSEWHGADIFLDAFARFSLAHPGYRMLFIGNGSARHAMEERVAAEGLNGIEFRDPVSGPDLNELLNGALASLASLKPGQGYDYAFTTKIYSSLAAGCPTVFTGIGPVVEFLHAASTPTYAGNAVSYDVQHVATALAEVARTPLTGAQRSELSDWTRSNYSLERIAQSVVATAMSEAAAR